MRSNIKTGGSEVCEKDRVVRKRNRRTTRLRRIERFAESPDRQHSLARERELPIRGARLTRFCTLEGDKQFRREVCLEVIICRSSVAAPHVDDDLCTVEPVLDDKP